MPFEQHVDTIAQRSSSSRLYPRPDLNGLNKYLKRNMFGSAILLKSAYLANSVQHDIRNTFAVVHVLSSKQQSTFGPAATEVSQFSALGAMQEPTLTFLRGHGSPAWIKAIADKSQASPEFFRRHLQGETFSLDTRNLYASPSLPSASTRVFQLTISTICSRGESSLSPEPEDLQSLRKAEAGALRRYFQELRSDVKVADSIVRNCMAFSRTEHVLEQAITVEVGPVGTSWRAVIWLDNGKDLSQTVRGPWSPAPGSRSWETYFLPIIVKNTNEEASKSAKDRELSTTSSKGTAAPLSPAPSPSTQSNTRLNEEWEAAQNICMLPFEYAAHIDCELASRDALYALNQIFQFAATSESQLLNLLDSRIEHELSFIGLELKNERNATLLLNLKYIKAHLRTRIQRLQETVDLLENRQMLDWPRAASSAIAEKAALLLLTDFRHLVRQAKSLSRDCEHGIATLADSSVLEESRRALDNAERVHKLTVLATVFIPLTFTCSIFGMNFKEFGQGSLPLWIWGATIGPVILTSLCLYYLKAITRFYHERFGGAELAQL